MGSYFGGGIMLRGIVVLVSALTVFSAAVGSDSGTRHPTGPLAGPPRPLPFFYDVYTFRGDAGRTTVITSFAVPARWLGQDRVGHEVRYRFDVSSVLADTARRSVTRTDDSVFVSRPWPLDGDHLLHTHVEVEAPPSSTTLQRVIMTDATRPGVGQLYRSPFAIPDYSGGELMLSDIALGLPGATSGWNRGDVTLALLPTSQFPESAFDVYYEIYNLPSGTPYGTEISIEPVDESGDPRAGGDRAVRARFSGESMIGGGGYVAELRRVETARPKGRFRLTVTVTDESTGRTATRSRPFRVQGWGAGATLVPALPRGGQAPPGA
jgi:hypothetical protein